MTLVSLNPATGQHLQSYPVHSPADCLRALEQVAQAQRGWRELSPRARAEHLMTLAAALRAGQEQLARLISLEMGKPLSAARLEIEKCAACCDFYASHGPRQLRPVRPPGAASNARVHATPLGVVLAIMPWNYPFWQFFRAAIPALLAGNTLLLKHAGNVSGCALAIEALFATPGLPTGLVRTLLVPSASLPPLIADARVAALTLTGSTAAGRQVAALAGAALKPCVLELGGSDPYLVLADADLDHAAEVCAAARLVNGGQSCIAAKRIIIAREIEAEFVPKFLGRLAARQVGDPLASTSDLGPLARADLKVELQDQVNRSLAYGAQLLFSGEAPAGDCFYPVQALGGVRPGMAAFDEELFGPVAALITAKDEAEAVQLANHTPYGLGAAIFSQDRRRAEELARAELEASMIFINEQVRSEFALPFGGIRESGYGRELGPAGLFAFVNQRTIVVR